MRLDMQRRIPNSGPFISRMYMRLTFDQPGSSFRPLFFFRTGRRRRSAAAALNIQLAINSQGAAAARRTHTQKKKKNNFKRRRQRLLVRSRAEASRPTRGGRRIVIWPQMTIDPPPLLWGLPT